MDQWTCINCLEIKPLYKFPKDKGCKLGYRPICKKCEYRYDPLTPEKRKIKNEEKRLDKYDLGNDDFKICYRCNKEKHLCKYNFCKGIPNATCIECMKIPMTTEQRKKFEDERRERYFNL